MSQEDFNKKLYKAIEKGDTKRVQTLIDVCGTDIEARGNPGTYGLTPLMYAAAGGHIEVVKLLLKAGAKVEAEDYYGDTPLIYASKKGEGNIEIVKLLLNAGAEVEAKDSLGRAPLILASKQGHVELVKLLLKSGAEVEVKNRWGDTPLIRAALNGHNEVVQLLLKAGANIHGRIDLFCSLDMKTSEEIINKYYSTNPPNLKYFKQVVLFLNDQDPACKNAQRIIYNIYTKYIYGLEQKAALSKEDLKLYDSVYSSKNIPTAVRTTIIDKYIGFKKCSQCNQEKKYCVRDNENTCMCLNCFLTLVYKTRSISELKLNEMKLNPILCEDCTELEDYHIQSKNKFNFSKPKRKSKKRTKRRKSKKRSKSKRRKSKKRSKRKSKRRKSPKRKSKRKSKSKRRKSRKRR